MVESSPFCGESRRLLVDGLVSVFDQVCSDGGPCLVSLEAPSGWGKTRVAREFYARLAAGQSEPRYWPAAIEDPDQGRKAVRPARFERPGGSLPEFFWWGIACGARNGVPTSLLRVDLEQLYGHAESLEDACRDLGSAGGRLRPMLARARRVVAEEVAQEGAAAAVGEVAAAAVPFVGILARLAAMGVKGHQARRQDQARIAASSVPGESADSDIVDEAVALLRDVCRRGLPVVVFVEDLHLADAMLLELLDKLLCVEGPIMVISTTWPDKIDTKDKLVELLESHRDRLHRVGHTKVVEDGAAGPFPPGAGLTELDEQARQQIVRSYYPEVGADVLQALTDRYQNPHAVETACQLLKEWHPGPRPDITPDDVTHLPLEIVDLYLAIWNEIPKETRIALAVAHTITPTNISGTNVSDPELWRAGGDNRWTQAVLHDVINSLGLLDREGVLKELANAPHAYAWVRVIDDYLRSFAESVQSDIVQDVRPRLLASALGTRDAHEQILNVLAAALTDGLEDHPDTINRARTILVLHAEGFLSAPAVVAHAINAILRDLQDAPRELPERVRLYQVYRTLDPHQVPTQTQFEIRDSGAGALGESGNTKDAIAAFEVLLADQVREMGADNPSTLRTRNNLACWLGEAGRVDEAIAAFEVLLADQVRELGADNPSTLTTRNNLAGWLGRAGRVDEAIAAFEVLLADQVRELGADNPSTLTTRNNLASCLGRAGRVDEAIAAIEVLLADQVRELGADNPSTLRTRNNLASFLGEAGRVDEAIAAFEVLLADQVRELGADNPSTLTTRNNLAGWLGEAGRFDEAIAAFEVLLADQVRELGADNPSTLTTRNNLALRLGEAGRFDEAIAAFEVLLADQVRELGADNPSTLTTRNNLALRLGEAGRFDEAIAAFEVLLADQVRELGADNPSTLTTRNNLALRLGEAGRVDEAIAAFEVLLADQVRELGADNPSTLTTRHNLASFLGEAGRFDEAIAAFEVLLADQVRELGADNPSTLTTRHNLASFLGEAGRFDEAIAAFEVLLADQVRELGADNPSTLTTRHNLASFLGEAGRFDEAIAAFEVLLADQVRELGADNPSTLTTRHNLASFLGRAGRAQEP